LIWYIIKVVSIGNTELIFPCQFVNLLHLLFKTDSYSFDIVKNLLFLFIFINSLLNDTKSFSRQIYSTGNTDTLTTFHLIHYSGDEAVKRYEMRIFKQSNKYYAEYISPLFYVGTRIDTGWKVELGNEKIQECIKFLSIAKNLPHECEEISSSVEDYEIMFTNDTLKIKGDCNWTGLDFFGLTQILFKDRLLELEMARKRAINSLNTKIAGKWYFSPLSKRPKMDDYIILTRANSFQSNCFWEFGDNNNFKSSCNEFLDLTHSVKYEWHLEEHFYLVIQGGVVTDKYGTTTVTNYGAIFILDSLGDNKLLLKFLWK
jgi:hypothetical protein